MSKTAYRAKSFPHSTIQYRQENNPPGTPFFVQYKQIVYNYRIAVRKVIHMVIVKLHKMDIIYYFVEWIYRAIIVNIW